MRNIIKIISIFSLIGITNCSLIEDFREDSLGLDPQPVDICEEFGQQCYMEDGEKIGMCQGGNVKADGLNCSDCGMCVGCSITNLETCIETSCQINKQEILINPGDPRRFSHMDKVRHISQESCDDLKGLGNPGDKK